MNVEETDQYPERNDQEELPTKRRGILLGVQFHVSFSDCHNLYMPNLRRTCLAANTIFWIFPNAISRGTNHIPQSGAK